MTRKPNVRYAYYSAAAAAKYGTTKWRAADGSETELTVVLRERDGSSYKWPDKEYRGPVVAWISGELDI